VSGSSDERSLATQLAAMDVPALAALLHRRGVAASANWHDAFDAAEALLDAASVDRALIALPRPLLIALATAGAGPVEPAGRARLAGLALLHADGTVLRGVAGRVAAQRTEHPDAFLPLPAPEPPARADAAAEAAAAERAVMAVAALADLLALGAEQPVTTTAAGAVSATDRRRLVELHLVGDGDELDDLLATGRDAGLLQPVDREWRLTERGAAWLPGSTLERWTSIASSLRDALPKSLRTASGGMLPPEAWHAVVPLDPAWPSRTAAMRRRAVRWGLWTPDGAEPAWTVPLRAGDAPGTETLASVIPAEIDAIYLQADLSAIAPGPLQPSLDLRLRTMADRESRAQASTYRFSEESLAAAVAAGETAATIREFLSRLSLTGIPQPLDYLIDRTTARHGLVRVRADAATARTHVESDDAHLLQTISVDHALRSIGLVPNEAGLVSRVSREAVFWTLADARYPVVAIGDDGAPESLRRRRPLVAAAASADPATALRPLAERIRSGGGDSDTAWLERELDQAVRARATITVAVRLPDSSTREFTLEATGMGGGRLRGRDRGADIERTLPVSSIVGVRPA